VLQPEVRCVEFVEQITEWLDGGLSDDARLLFEEHLAYCSPCDRYVAQFRQALLLLHEDDPDAPEDRAGPMVRAQLLAAFRARRP
jgi:anti-sigma factor RsiW